MAGQAVGDVEPGDALVVEAVGARHQDVGVVEGADVELDDRPQIAAVALPGQRRPTVAAEGAADAGRSFVDLALGSAESDLAAGEAGQGNHRPAVVLAAAMAVAMGHREWLSAGLVAHRAAHAAAAVDFACVAQFVLLGCRSIGG